MISEHLDEEDEYGEDAEDVSDGYAPVRLYYTINLNTLRTAVTINTYDEQHFADLTHLVKEYLDEKA